MVVSQQKHSLEVEKKVHRPPQSHVRYKAYFFGPFHVTLDEQQLGEPSWRRNKARMLLKWFLLNPGELFSMDQLSKMFWPDVTREVAVRNMHVTVHHLRHVLEPELAPGCPSTFICRNRHNYYWFDLTDAWWTDLLDIQHLTAAAKEAERTGNLARTFALYGRLTSYYSMTFLPEDIYEDIFSPYRRQHDYAYTQLIEHMMQLYVQANQLDDALSCALNILSINPYSEEAVNTIVRIHLQQGNTTGALRQLDDFGSFLKKDLDIELGKELLTLRSSILKTR